MQIGVVSDTHIPVSKKEIPNKVLELLKGVELIIHAGDIVELTVLEELSKIAPVEAVAGNMDGYEVRQVLPEQKIIEVGGFKIGITHTGGAGTTAHLRALDAFYGKDVDCIVFGHSHQAFNAVHEGILLFNPGSPTVKRFSLKTSLGFLELGEAITGKIVYLD